jgi:CBS-domain-containing membrane protein
MKAPKDPFMLLSYVNTKLRDEYTSLDDLCEGLDIDRRHLETVLSSIDYSYIKEKNRFTAK